MVAYDLRNDYLDEVLDFYLERRSAAFEEALMIAFDNAQGYCRECTHCAEELRRRKRANYHKWRKPDCRCGHPYADKRFYPFKWQWAREEQRSMKNNSRYYMIH